MTYTLSKSQKAIQKAAMEFAKGEFDKDAAREFDKKSAFPEAAWKKAADLGFIGTHWPEKFGGGGMGSLENTLVAETLARADSTTGAAIMLAGHAADWLVRFGNEAQQKAILPGILEGKTKSGASVSHSITRQNGFVRMDTDSATTWRLNGQLDSMANGREAGVFFLVCGNCEGTSMLAIEAGRPGVAVEKDHSMLGLRMTGTARIKFDDVLVSQEDLIGKQNQGLVQANRALPEFHLLMAALSLGTAQGAFDRALVHVREREQFGRKIAGFQVTRHKLADMAIRIEQARCLTYQAAIQADQEKTALKMAAMANLAATRAAEDITFEAIQLLGGYGYTTEYDVERCYRDAKTLRVLSGSGNDLADGIADTIIGKLKK